MVNRDAYDANLDRAETTPAAVKPERSQSHWIILLCTYMLMGQLNLEVTDDFI
jgi:hypothetical protein